MFNLSWKQNTLVLDLVAGQPKLAMMWRKKKFKTPTQKNQQPAAGDSLKVDEIFGPLSPQL